MTLSRNDRRALLLGRAEAKTFRKYYRSAHWQQRRAQKLAKDPICQLCRRRPATQVHHKGYSCLFKEHLDRDLDSVCASCHRRISR